MTASVRVEKVDAHDTTVSVSAPLRHLCPFKPEIDEGRITITWMVSGETFELHALADYLAAFADIEISHEALTERICRDLGPTVVAVSTRWVTAGMDVTVDRIAPVTTPTTHEGCTNV